MEDIVPQKVPQGSQEYDKQNTMAQCANDELGGDNEIINDRNDYLDDFRHEINKLEHNCCCFCSAGCNLWVGVHLWLIWLIIANCFSIFLLKFISDLLSISCAPDINHYDDQYIECSAQEMVHDAGITSAIIQFYFVFYSIGLFMNLAGFYGIYQCDPTCILLPIIFISLASVSDICWLIVTWQFSVFYFIYIGTYILRLWAIYILFKCYQFAKYFTFMGNIYIVQINAIKIASITRTSTI